MLDDVLELHVVIQKLLAVQSRSAAKCGSLLATQSIHSKMCRGLESAVARARS